MKKKKKKGLNGYVAFSVDHNILILILSIFTNIYWKSIIWNVSINQKAFIASLSLSRSLTSITVASVHTKCISLNNQKYITQPTLLNLHPNEYT